MSLQKIPVLHRLLKKAICEDCCIILDLEDTLDSTDKKKSRVLKQWGRDGLIKFAQLYPDFFKTDKIGVRVNSIKSQELENDLKALAETSKVWDFFCIIGPKVESSEDIFHLVNLLEIHRVRYKTFIPIIETIKGFENLSSIVANKSLRYAIYGHNDYSLESKHYPFLEQDETEFWKIVSNFIKKVEAEKIRYVHTPLFHFADKSLTYQVCLQLQKRCALPHGIVTINSFQTSLFNQIKY